MRMAYGYQYLYGQEEKAIPYAQRWAELDPEANKAANSNRIIRHAYRNMVWAEYLDQYSST